MDQQLVGMSRFLSYLLRHHPEAEGIAMDQNGWVSVEELLNTPGAKDRGLTRALLARVVTENDKQRFEFDEAGERIRARQGHSLTVSLDLTPECPPEFLYHGTSAPALSSIRREGLRKQKRQHVHLSADAETAERVGARHGSPVVLLIKASEMHQQGCEFFVSANGIWLTDHVPLEFIHFPRAENPGSVTTEPS